MMPSQATVLHRLAVLLLTATMTVDGFATATSANDATTLALDADDPEDSGASHPPLAPHNHAGRRRRRTAATPRAPTDLSVRTLGDAAESKENISTGDPQWLSNGGMDAGAPRAVFSAWQPSATVSGTASTQPMALDAFPASSSLVLELHLPGQTLQKLRSQRGPLSDLLHALQHSLAKAAGVGNESVAVLGLHGRYRQMDHSGPGPLRGDSALDRAARLRVNEEVVVRFRLAAEDGGAASSRELEALHVAVDTPTGKLHQGSLGPLFQNASVTLSLSSGLAIPRANRDAVARMSAMALPIGVSAAFTGILIWLAAW